MPANLPVPTRPRDGAMLGGVCVGLARRWRIDPNLLRIALVVLVFFGGFGVAIYGAGLALMPKDGTSGLPIRRYLPFTRTWSDLGVIALTVGGLALLAGIPSHGIGLGPILVIGAVWYFGFRHHSSSTTPTVEPTPFERQAEAWRVRLAEQQAPGYEQAALAAPPVAPVAASAPLWQQPYTDPADLAVRDNLPPALVAQRQHRRGRWLLAGVLSAVGVVLVAVLGIVFGQPMGPLPYFAAILAALGVALVASSKGGRPPLMLPATILAAVITVALMAPLPHTIGDQALAFGGSDVLPDSLSVDLGSLDVNLSKLQLTADDTLNVDVGTGDLELTVPAQGTTIVTYHVGLGDYSGINSVDGAEVTGTDEYGSGSPVLRINANVKLGSVSVHR